MLKDKYYNDILDKSIKRKIFGKSKKYIMKFIDESNLSDRDIFYIGCEEGILSIVKDALEKGIDPSIDNNRSIQIASEHGYVDIVEELLKDDRVDPTANGESPIRWSSFNGHINVVKLLLKDNRVDPTHPNKDLCARNWALVYGHEDIVKLLDEYIKNKNING